MPASALSAVGTLRFAMPIISEELYRIEITLARHLFAIDRVGFLFGVGPIHQVQHLGDVRAVGGLFILEGVGQIEVAVGKAKAALAGVDGVVLAVLGVDADAVAEEAGDFDGERRAA